MMLCVLVGVSVYLGVSRRTKKNRQRGQRTAVGYWVSIEELSSFRSRWRCSRRCSAFWSGPVDARNDLGGSTKKDREEEVRAEASIISQDLVVVNAELVVVPSRSCCGEKRIIRKA